jgi:hypothetical protein
MFWKGAASVAMVGEEPVVVKVLSARVVPVYVPVDPAVVANVAVAELPEHAAAVVADAALPLQDPAVAAEEAVAAFPVQLPLLPLTLPVTLPVSEPVNVVLYTS